MAEHLTATGFGVVHDGKLMIRTVSDTEQAAMVNGLALIFNVWTQDHATFEQIKAGWERCVDPGTHIVPVTCAAEEP